MELLQEMELEKEVICGKVQEKFHISSQEAAQEVAEQLVSLGIRGFWNYSHCDLAAAARTVVRFSMM